MKFISFMLGSSLIKKEKKLISKRISKSEKDSRRIRKKVSVEVFLRESLGTHLIKKEF
jgi:hypothetical protein